MTHINKAQLGFNFTLKPILPKLKEEVLIHTQPYESLLYNIEFNIHNFFRAITHFAILPLPSYSDSTLLFIFMANDFMAICSALSALALFGIQHQSSVAKRKASKRSSFGNRNNFWFQRVQNGLNDWLIDDQSVYYKMKWNLSKEKVSIFLLFPRILHLLKSWTNLLKTY